MLTARTANREEFRDRIIFLLPAPAPSEKPHSLTAPSAISSAQILLTAAGVSPSESAISLRLMLFLPLSR